MSAGAFVCKDARKAEALELRRALVGFGSAAFLPRDGNDPPDAASGVTESFDDSEDEEDDSIHPGDFGLVPDITAFST